VWREALTLAQFVAEYFAQALQVLCKFIQHYILFYFISFYMYDQLKSTSYRVHGWSTTGTGCTRQFESTDARPRKQEGHEEPDCCKGCCTWLDILDSQQQFPGGQPFRQAAVTVQFKMASKLFNHVQQRFTASRLVFHRKMWCLPSPPRQVLLSLRWSGATLHCAVRTTCWQVVLDASDDVLSVSDRSNIASHVTCICLLCPSTAD